MYGLSHGAYWGLSLEAPAPSSLPPDVLRDLERAGVVPPGTAAQVGGVVVTKRLKQTRRPELVTAPGPLHLGQPQGGTVRDLYGASWALALYRGGPQLFQARAGVWVDRTDPDALGELVKGGVRHVSLAFDQAARPVLAWERDGKVYVRQWGSLEGRYVTRGPWSGCDPVLFADAVLLGDSSDSDVLLYHLDGGAVVSRVQREEYHTPRLALNLGDVAAALDQVIPAGLGLQVVGMTSAGTRWVARSAAYPMRTFDRLTGTARLTGKFVDVVQRRDGSDAMTGAASVTGNLLSVSALLAYADVMTGAGSVTGSLVVVQIRQTPTDTLNGTGSLTGSLLVVVTQQSFADGLTGTGSVTGVLA